MSKTIKQMKNNLFTLVVFLLAVIFFTAISTFCVYRGYINYDMVINNRYDYSMTDVIIPIVMAIGMLFAAYKFAIYAGYELKDYQYYLEDRKENNNEK